MEVTKVPKKIVTVIEPKRSMTVDKEKYRQKRVAAYCRVSTDSEEQLVSYTNQKKVYTEMIASRKDWCFAGLFADATVIIGLKQNPTNGRRFSPIFYIIGHFVGQNTGCHYKPRRKTEYGTG